MKKILPLSLAIVALAFGVLGRRTASSQHKQDKYSLKVPGGLAFSDFKGYEDWQAVGPSLTDGQSVIRLILANPVMTGAYRQGVPGSGKPFPDGSKIAKIVWQQKKLTAPPFSASTPDTVPGDLLEVEFIEKWGRWRWRWWWTRRRGRRSGNLRPDAGCGPSGDTALD
jgi:hypothetical protein